MEPENLEKNATCAGILEQSMGEEPIRNRVVVPIESISGLMKSLKIPSLPTVSSIK
jgi:hypothetical protein